VLSVKFPVFTCCLTIDRWGLQIDQEPLPAGSDVADRRMTYCNTYAFTSDGCRTNHTTARHLNARFVWCASHRVNLGVNDGFMDPRSSTARDFVVRGKTICNSVNSSTCKVQALDYVVEELEKVEHIEYSSDIPSPNETRWSSQFVMLDALYKKRQALQLLSAQDPKANLGMSTPTRNTRHCPA